MTPKKLLLGIDIGGTGCKAAVYEHNQCYGVGYAEYQMNSQLPGQAEQDGEAWWQAACQAIRQATSHIDTGLIAAIGVGCTNGLICVDAQAKPLRPAIMLWDQRAYPQAEYLRQKIGEQEIFRITGNPAAPGTYSLPTLLWMKENEPDLLAKTYRFLVPGGFLVARLTGVFTIDYSRSCTTMLFDIRNHVWHEPFVNLLDLPTSIFPDPVPSTQIVGGVTSGAAQETGLKAGTPVIAGCMDTLGAAIGAGCLNQGDYFIIMGTAARVCVPIDKPEFDPAFMNCSTHLSDRFLAFGAINGVGASLRWVRDVLAVEEANQARQTNQDVYDLITAKAAQAPPGSKGLIFLPYLSGERTPIWDPKARGAFFGLTLGHSRAEIFRSVLEGTAFAIRQSLDLLQEKYHLPLHSIRIGGSAAKSAVWNQIIADVTGIPLHSISENHIEVLGAAYLAGMSIGLMDENDCVKTEPSIDVFEPNTSNARKYQRLYSVYQSIYPECSSLLHDLADIENS